MTTLVGLGVRLAKPAMRASLVHALCPTAISSQLNISKSNAEAALRILDIFCQSADTDIDERHLSNLDRVFAGSVLDILDKVDAARKLWQDIVDGKFSVTRDAIFKMMSLDAPALLVDDIYVDDAEDLTPAQIHFLQQQVHARIIWAGDPEQQLQGNLAALDASARLGPVTILNQSFRMTPEVADLCNLVAAGSPAGLAKAGLDQSPLLLKGGCDFLALSRFNVQKSVVIARWDSTLLSMAFETMGEGVHWVGGCDAVARAFAIYYLWKGCDETMTLPSDEMSSQSRTDDVTAFSSYALLKDFAIHTHNQQLLVLTEIVEKYAESTPQIALRILRNAVPRMDDPGCREIYATPERAKGMRWESVTLAQDFRGDVSDPAERALLYLACSRAEVNVTGPGLWTSKWF
ncbi:MULTISPECIES: hypothetical protein [unclassified Burkholderia]|uniref:hypothetical protein n=1 Tax=unclassified Burkholderia TaxID=2613784 RepID=UPI002AB074A8|nr:MULTISPECIES: hypothetical protein [unclassified Burkholderia]